MLRIVQNGRILFCSHGLKIRAIGVNVFILLLDKDFNSGNGKRIGEVVDKLNRKFNLAVT
jgi:hypothetical protein